MTCIPKGAADSSIPSQVDRPDGGTVLANGVSCARHYENGGKNLFTVRALEL